MPLHGLDLLEQLGDHQIRKMSSQSIIWQMLSRWLYKSQGTQAPDRLRSCLVDAIAAGQGLRAPSVRYLPTER